MKPIAVALAFATLLAAPVAAQEAAPVVDCLSKCPAGTVAPRFEFLPRMEIMEASVGVYDRRSRTFAQFEAVIAPDGTIEPESLVLTGGTARQTESEVRRALAQARFTPGRTEGAAVRARVRLRFDFEAEGTSWVKYTYKVTAR